MTELEALEKCSKMWHWLYEHQDKGKWEYDFPDERPMNGCYLCQYIKDIHHRISPKNCDEFCPLRDFWPRKSPGEDYRIYDRVPCERVDSPYTEYCEGDHSVAIKIAEAADREIEKLKQLKEN